MTEPINTTEPDPAVAVAVTAVKSLVDNAKALGLTWSLRPGVVAVDSPLTSSDVQVVMDGDSAILTVVSLVGPILADQRIMVASVPPGGLYIVGSSSHDQWHGVGTSTGPPFAANWTSFGAPGGGVGFRRTLDGHLELTGLADFLGTAAAPNVIFTLPVGWRPDRLISLIITNNPGTTTAPTPRGLQILATGEVQVVHYAGSIDPGLIALDGIYVALRTGI